jgi:hypothetical protein
VAAGILNRCHPPEVACVLRHLELAHRRATQLVLCQELRLIVFHEWEQPVAALLPFAGPKQVLAYLARYTHRVAIANSRLISLAEGKVCFRWKDYRQDGEPKSMTLAAGEFIRRFLLHVLPDGFHRIRHYGLFANGHRANKPVGRISKA